GEPEERLGVVVVFSDTTEERKRRKIKRLFGEYVDPRIVERILSRDEASRSRHAEMTISFVDMRNFTGWSERLDVDTLIDVLNRFLAAMTEPIGQAGGITDKYIGDSVMACWGPPFTDASTQAVDACKAALGQMAALPALREELAAAGVDGAQTLDAVVGLATGGVIAGDVGPPSSRNYTVIGNAVNLAARLQEAAKVYGHSVIVSEETMVQASGPFVFRELDKMLVRGLSFPTSIYALLGPKEDVSEETIALATRYNDGLAHLRAQNFGPAREAFTACLAQDPHDVPSSLMLRRIDQLQEYPLPADWDGVWRVAGAAMGADRADDTTCVALRYLGPDSA
ncbi:MAG: adenylate/guanylate cyclase domain-containing protein, partial [Pseudomonadota bacterium]